MSERACCMIDRLRLLPRFAFVRIWMTVLFIFSSHLALAETRINIWGSTDTAAFQSVLVAFERVFPEIETIYHEVSSNELFDLVYSARDRGDRSIDVVISSAMDLQVKLVNEGLALPVHSDAAKELPNWARWRNELFGFTYEPIVLFYNKNALSHFPLPRTHSELADLLIDNLDTFEGKVGTYNANSSGAGYLFITQDAIQSDRVFRVIEALSRAKMRTYEFTSAILDAVASNELILGYNVIGTYALQRSRQDDNLGVLEFSDYTIVMSRTAFVYKHTTQRAASERFVEFLLSDAGQMAIAENSYLIPINARLRKEKFPASGTNADLPIKLDIALLTYLDKLKRQNFLEVWNSIFQNDSTLGRQD
ncbi:ABC transporter substrate-binding protein [uncultured Cohaesibacter sp.]|uniref:ABC transporter substrate-binding protein n=1 Tax=uncultured Cohaesibacter sp. TaxID=1002546 RepID=UPI00292E1810|nr:ABC transporter substrate-binding protein [uncultured Cohaesibacter sp.]